MTIKDFQKKYKLNNSQLAKLINSYAEGHPNRPLDESRIRDWKGEGTKVVTPPSWIYGWFALYDEYN